MELRKISETSTTITLGWTPPADVGGYVFYANNQPVSTGSPKNKDGTPRSEVRFSKTAPGPPFHVVAVVEPTDGTFAVDIGAYGLVTPPPPPELHLLMSRSPDRSNPAPLEGQELTGSVFVFTQDEPAVDPPVRFFLDGALVREEANAPYDYAGGSSAAANPWDTVSVPNGQHVIRAVDESGLEASASFDVENGVTPPPDPGDGEVVFRIDFEFGNQYGIDLQKYAMQCENIEGEPIASRGTVRKVPRPGGPGNAGKFTLPPSATGGRSACEIMEDRRSDQGATDYYAMEVYFPADWREPSSSHWGMSFIQANYTAIKGGPVCMFAHVDYVNLVMETGAIDGSAQYTTGNGTASGNIGTFYAIPRERFAKEVWHQLILRVTWRTDNQGVVEVWHRRKGETQWVKTAEVRGYPTWQWRAGNDPNAVKTTNDKFGANRGGASYEISYLLDNLARATTFEAAASVLQ